MSLTNYDGSITYDPELLATTIEKTSVLNNQNADFSGLISSVNSYNIPSASIAASLSALTKDALNIFPDEIDDLYECLKDVKQKYDDCIGYNQTDIHDLIAQYGGNMVFTKIGEQEGWLYLPNGYTSTVGLPLIVFMAGSDESKDKDGMLRRSLPNALANGLNINAAVWCPLHKNSYKESIFNSIDTLVNEKGFDKSRISLIGYSKGSSVSQFMLEAHPDYFSAFVSTGTVSTNQTTQSKIKIPTILIDGSNDCGNEDGKYLYNSLVKNGTPVMRYKINGGDHGTTQNILVNEGLLSDLISIKKGDHIVTPENNWIEVTYKEVYPTSLVAKLKGEYTGPPSFYQRLSNNTYVPADAVNVSNVNGETKAMLVKTPDIDYEALKGKYNIEYDANPPVTVEVLPDGTAIPQQDSTPRAETMPQPHFSEPNLVNDGNSQFYVADAPHTGSTSSVSYTSGTNSNVQTANYNQSTGGLKNMYYTYGSKNTANTIPVFNPTEIDTPVVSEPTINNVEPVVTNTPQPIQSDIEPSVHLGASPSTASTTSGNSSRSYAAIGIGVGALLAGGLTTSSAIKHNKEDKKEQIDDYLSNDSLGSD